MEQIGKNCGIVCVVEVAKTKSCGFDLRRVDRINPGHDDEIAPGLSGALVSGILLRQEERLILVRRIKSQSCGCSRQFGHGAPEALRIDVRSQKRDFADRLSTGGVRFCGDLLQRAGYDSLPMLCVMM